MGILEVNCFCLVFLRVLEPELRPEFIESLKASETEKTVKVKNFESRYSK